MKPAPAIFLGIVGGLIGGIAVAALVTWLCRIIIG